MYISAVERRKLCSCENIATMNYWMPFTVFFVLLCFTLLEGKITSEENAALISTTATIAPRKCSGFQKFLQNIKDRLSEGIQFLFNSSEGVFEKLFAQKDQILKFVNKHWEKLSVLKDAIANVVDSAPEGLRSLWSEFKTKFLSLDDVVKLLREHADKNYNETYEKFEAALMSTADFVNKSTEQLTEDARTAGCDLRTFEERMNDFVEKCSEASEDCVVDLRRSMSSTYKEALDLFETIARKAQNAYYKVKDCRAVQYSCKVNMTSAIAEIAELYSQGKDFTSSLGNVAFNIKSTLECLENVKKSTEVENASVKEEIKNCEKDEFNKA